MWAAAMVAAGVGMAAWAIRAANRHDAATPLIARLVVAAAGASGVLTALAAVVRVL